MVLTKKKSALNHERGLLRLWLEWDTNIGFRNLVTYGENVKK